MQKWLICLAAVAAGGLLAGGAATVSIDDLGRQSTAQAGPDLAASGDLGERGIQPLELSGEVGSALRGAAAEIADEVEAEIEGVDPTLVPEPTPLFLVSLGMIGLVIAGRRRLPSS